MRVKNLRNVPVSIAPPGSGRPVEVDAGESVEVVDDLGRALLAQPDRWAPAGKTDVNASVPSVLAQVGDNRDRARTALEAEQASDNPRKSLIDSLTKIIESKED